MLASSSSFLKRRKHSFMLSVIKTLFLECVARDIMRKNEEGE
jgi:hypothetical protein